MAGCFDKEAWIGLLRGEGLSLAGEHLALCPACRKRFLETAMERGAVDRLLQTLARERDCLDYMELSDCLEGNPASAQALIAWLHLHQCRLCQEEITSLAQGRRAARSLPEVMLAPARDPSRQDRLSSWRQPFRWQRPVQWAAAAGLLLALGWGLHQWIGVPESRLHVAKTNLPDGSTERFSPEMKGPEDTPERDATNRRSTRNAPESRSQPDNRPAASERRIPPSSARPRKRSAALKIRPQTGRSRPGSRRRPEPSYSLVLAKLKDGAGHARLYAGGRVKLSGNTPGLPDSLAALVRQKVASGSLDADRPLQMAMASPLPDVVRSSVGDIKLKEPVGTAVLSDRPRMVWIAPEEGILCRVTVYGEDGSPIWEGTTTNRAVQVEKPLPGGRLYHWDVSADNGDTILSSTPARFRVLEESRRKRVEGLARRYRGWHLALGTLYESEGLYREALTEFRELARLNPSSAPAHRMLEGIEHKVKGTSTKGRM